MPRGLDHLVVATRDLGAGADFYRSLGFSVGQRNRHPWGTLNHIIQFPGCFLELIALEPGFVRPRAGEPVGQFANFLADYLADREGMAMLVLESRDAAADQSDFGAHGIAGASTFFFERSGKRPDGSDVHVAFTLAFASTPEIRDAGFFVCQQHFPENFWNPAFQSHDNGVAGVTAAVMAAAEPLRHVAFLEAYTGGGEVRRTAGGVEIRTPRGRIDVLTPDGVEAAFGFRPVTGPEGPRFVAIQLSCPDMGRAEAAVAASGVRHARVGRATVLHPDAGRGVALAFAPPEA